MDWRGEFDKVKDGFRKQTSLNDALLFMSGDSRWCHEFYQHYTTIDRVIDKINGDWWMTRADNTRLNDLQESRKFGIRNLYEKTYQISLSYGKAESASMWGLYSYKNPFGMRITISGRAMRRWINSIALNESTKSNEKTVKYEKLGLSKDENLRLVDLRDVIYAPATLDTRDKDKYTRKRYNKISWGGVFADEIKDLASHRRNPLASAILKDYEWRHEQESRIIVGYDESEKCEAPAIKIKVPDYVISDMRFTFSPWLDDKYFVGIESMIRDIYNKRGIKLKGGKEYPFKRSNLQGALNFGV